MSEKRPSRRMAAQSPTLILTAQNVESVARAWSDGDLDAAQVAEIERQLAAQPALKAAFERRCKLLSVVSQAVGGQPISPDFDERASQRLANRHQIRSTRITQGLESSSEALTALSLGFEEDRQAAANQRENAVGAFAQSLGAAPWWIVSVSLHALAILLISLITMTIGSIGEESEVVVVTNIEKQALLQPKDEPKEKPVARDILESKVDVQATDPLSTEQSNIIVPPDILAKAELGDHFETINPDRPDTQSAFGNPDARMFHSVEGNDEPEGGGGAGGMSLLEDVIGVGGSASPGTGGGWGGGNGTGTGIGTGSGHGSFGQRTGGGRRLMVMKHGGTKQTESAVDKALEWLARNQEADGRWDGVKHGASGPCDPAVSGLALLAFLGAGHTEKVGKYKDNVKRGIEWLIKQQGENGRIPKEQIGHLGYNCAIAGMALAEAAGMGRVPATKEAAQKAIDYTVNIHQNGEGSDKGGWRYAAKSQTCDISVSGWFIMHLKSAKVAGLHVDPAAFDGGMKFLDTVEFEKAKPGDPYSGHRYAYTPGHVKDVGCNGAIGCLGRQFLGVKPEELQGGVEYFLEKGGLPEWKQQHLYYWYYATLCCFQQGGDIWKKWNEAMKKTLIENQCKDGANDGSWDPSGKWVSQKRGGGRVMSTALGAMCLEVYYRYLPLYRD